MGGLGQILQSLGIKMKYVEELFIGEFFNLNGEFFVNTQDFKKNKSRLAINLKTGVGQWMSHDSMVESIDLYTLDKDNNFISIREREKLNVDTKA